MASRRRLKKDINFLTYEVISNCYAYVYVSQDAKMDEVENIIKDIVKLRNDLVSRTNHPDGKDNPKMVKAYYKKIFKELLDGADDCFAKLSELIKK